MKALLLSACASASGKTTITAALMRALTNRGTLVCPYKNGPDYIDPMFHEKACGRPSVNLDAFMSGEEGVRDSFALGAVEDGLGLVEGAMGLFDGRGTGSEGSAAHTAKILGIPVVLIVDARGMSRSVAALVRGFRDFDLEVRIAGVILNRIKSPSHFELLRQILEEEGIEVFGYFPETPHLHLESRHLGLIPAEELTELDAQIDEAAEILSEHVDLDALIAAADEAACPKTKAQCEHRGFEGLRVALARDRAFNFYYEENLQWLRDQGAALIPFSPLEDERLPDCDALYLGGGYPEVFARELSENRPMRQSIRSALEEGLPCYAECGGMIYLMSAVTTKEKKTYPLVGFFPGEARMTDRLQHFGYATLALRLGGEEYRLNIHEFHHSVIENGPDTIGGITKGKRSWPGMMKKNNTLAGYPHLLVSAKPDGEKLFSRMLSFACDQRQKNGISHDGYGSREKRFNR